MLTGKWVLISVTLVAAFFSVVHFTDSHLKWGRSVS